MRRKSPEHGIVSLHLLCSCRCRSLILCLFGFVGVVEFDPGIIASKSVGCISSEKDVGGDEIIGVIKSQNEDSFSRLNN